MDLKAIYEYVEIGVTVIAAAGIIWRVAVFMQQAKVALTTDVPHIKDEMLKQTAALSEQTMVLKAQTAVLEEIKDKL
jgi:hypothetical protein